jgi:hypothetical protein
MRRLATVLGCSAALLAGSCSTIGAPRSKTYATIWADASETPMSVHREITYVGAVDGKSTRSPKGYVLVPAGTHNLTLVHENCWLPSAKERCDKSAETAIVVAALEAGVAYRVNGLSGPPRPVDPKKGR